MCLHQSDSWVYLHCFAHSHNVIISISHSLCLFPSLKRCSLIYPVFCIALQTCGTCLLWCAASCCCSSQCGSSSPVALHRSERSWGQAGSRSFWPCPSAGKPRDVRAKCPQRFTRVASLRLIRSVFRLLRSIGGLILDRTVSNPDFEGMAVFTPVINGEQKTSSLLK